MYPDTPERSMSPTGPPASRNPFGELERATPGGRNVYGKRRDRASLDAAVAAFEAYATTQGGSGGVLTVATLADGRVITLSKGLTGMKHVLTRHVAPYYNGTNQGGTTLFPGGTDWADVVSWVREAVAVVGVALPTAGMAAVSLATGMTVVLTLDGNRVASIRPDEDNSFGFNVSRDVEPHVP